MGQLVKVKKFTAIKISVIQINYCRAAEAAHGSIFSKIIFTGPVARSKNMGKIFLNKHIKDYPKDFFLKLKILA